jgi:hypothetical protein
MSGIDATAGRPGQRLHVTGQIEDAIKMHGMQLAITAEVNDSTAAGRLFGADLPRLPASFTHDFQKDGLPDKYFRTPERMNGVRTFSDTEGLHVSVEATGVWTWFEIIPRFGLSGDFDIEATFAGLSVESQKREAGIIFMTNINDPRKSIYGISRILTQEGFHGSQLSQAMAQPDGTRSWQAEMSPNSAASGRLRLARRGCRLHYLFAEGDSEIFRTFHTQLNAGTLCLQSHPSAG